MLIYTKYIQIIYKLYTKSGESTAKVFIYSAFDNIIQARSDNCQNFPERGAAIMERQESFLIEAHVKPVQHTENSKRVYARFQKDNQH
jgi:hypothetical protein